jgi:SAM-dependent methyltransferase
MPGAPSTRAVDSQALPALPGAWSVDAERMLALTGEERLPLPYADESFGLIHAGVEFTRLTGEWAEWLLELHRVAAPEGLVVAAVIGESLFEQLTGEAWDEDRVGMSLLRRWKPPRLGATFVVHSEWWIRAHWGRAFEVIEVERTPELVGQGAAEPELSGHTWVLLRRRPVELATEDLERAEPVEPREMLALRDNVSQLQRQLDLAAERIDAERAAELNALRESFQAELERKSVRIARAQKATEEAVHNFKSTLSWRVTKPLRALREASRSVRRR